MAGGGARGGGQGPLPIDLAGGEAWVWVGATLAMKWIHPLLRFWGAAAVLQSASGSEGGSMTAITVAAEARLTSEVSERLGLAVEAALEAGGAA